MDRDVYLRPPYEANCKGHVWKLKRCVYGLADASREWYLRVRDEFLRLGGEVSSFDPALFYWRVGPDIRGILGAHVDNFLHAGSKDFETEVINKMKQVFKVGTEHSEAFQYLGLHLNQDHNCILLDQIKYISNVGLIEMPSSRKIQKKSDVICEEQASLRRAIGQLNWASPQTRIDLAFETCCLSTKLNSAKVEDLVDANKALKKLKNERLVIAFPNLGNLTDLRVAVFADASYANLPNGASQEGFIIF